MHCGHKQRAIFIITITLTNVDHTNNNYFSVAFSNELRSLPLRLSKRFCLINLFSSLNIFF